MKKNITIKELSKILEVSISTVSKALNDSYEISDSTKERIKTVLFVINRTKALDDMPLNPRTMAPQVVAAIIHSLTIGGVTFEVMVGSGHAGKKGHNHLGLVVEDTQRTIDFYTKSLGLPPCCTHTRCPEQTESAGMGPMRTPGAKAPLGPCTTVPSLDAARTG